MPSRSRINELYGPQTKDIHDQFNAIKGGYVNSVLGLANQGLVLKIASAYDVSNPITFVAFMNSFSDTFSQNFQKDAVYGRMDPIQSYKNTERKLAMSWKLVSANHIEAEKNMLNISVLTKKMYPSYGGKRITRAPLMAIKYMNILRDTGAPASFLRGTISSLSITPDLEFGVFTSSAAAGKIFPKIIDLSISFDPIHAGVLGQNTMEDQHLYGLRSSGLEIGLAENDGVPQDRDDVDEAFSAYGLYQKEQLNTILSAQNDAIAREERPWERVGDKWKAWFSDEKENFKPE